MESASLSNHLLEYLGEEPVVPQNSNPTTLLRHGQIAQEWLLKSYLGAWIELIGGLVDCDYQVARANARVFKAVALQAKRIDPGLTNTEQIFFLGGLQAALQHAARSCGVATERSMQWGVWARDVPMAIAHGFSDTDFLNPVICEGIAPCSMYAAFLVSQTVTDTGVSEEIASKMFEELPRVLLDVLQRVPAAPEA